MKATGLEDGNLDNKRPGPPGWGFGVRLAPYHSKNKLASKSQYESAGRINGNRHKRVKRNMNKINIGTWNVLTLLKPGKMQELSEQLEKVKMDIVALQEIRWNGDGIINKKNFVLYYSGSQKKKGQAGTGFFVKKKYQNTVIDFEPYNERLCKLRIQSKYNKLTLINTYAPTEEKSTEMKEQFYEDLQNLIKKVPKSDTVIVLGDFNAQVGKEECYRSVSGRHSIHEITNGNGEMLCHFAIQNNLKIMSTQFQHKTIHKATWLSPDNNTGNQIDHVLITNKKSDLIEDVRSLRGPNIDSDHFLVKAIFKQSLPAKYRKKSEKVFKWNKQNLQCNVKLKEYKEVLYGKLKEENKNENENIDERWNKLRNTITEAAELVIQRQGKPERNEWWDDDCKKIMDEKNEARKKFLQMKTRASQDCYKNKRKEANKTCRNKKKKWLNDRLLKIEENFRMNDVRKFYKDVKNFNYSTKPTPTMCKDSEGNIQSEISSVLNRWREYFSNVFKESQIEGDNQAANTVNEERISEPEIGSETPTYNEICQIIRKLKTNKAPGPDNIPPELINHGGRTLNKKIYNLMKQIWEENKMPEQWKEGLICPIYKNGDRLKCTNYRPITLLNIVYKIFAILLNKRLIQIIQKKLGEYQMGFRENRSTKDNIFIVQQIFQKCHEYDVDLHNIFIDYTQAFDSVNRNKICECLKFYEIPNKLIQLITLTLTNTKAKVKIKNNISESFPIQSGVKQGDPLSATLFGLVIDYIFKKMELRGNISTKLKQCIAYADDIMITARTKHALFETFLNLKEESKQFGLIINYDKTKYLKCSSSNNNRNEDLKIDNMKINAIPAFKYLGVKVNGNNTLEEEIKERLVYGNKAYYANQSLFRSKLISKYTKWRLYKTLIRPVVTYASETWILKEAIKQKLMIFERKILRKIFEPNKQADNSWKIKTNAQTSHLKN